MAVREGFEPSIQLLTVYSLSRGAPSASRPPHHTLLSNCAVLAFESAHRHCVAHILLSRTYKSNNFSQLAFICTIPTQHGQFDAKKSVLSTGNTNSPTAETNVLFESNFLNAGGSRAIGRSPILLCSSPIFHTKSVINVAKQRLQRLWHESPRAMDRWATAYYSRLRIAAYYRHHAR